MDELKILSNRIDITESVTKTNIYVSYGFACIGLISIYGLNTTSYKAAYAIGFTLLTATSLLNTNEYRKDIIELKRKKGFIETNKLLVKQK